MDYRHEPIHGGSALLGIVWGSLKFGVVCSHD